jgi:hypothetical protein
VYAHTGSAVFETLQAKARSDRVIDLQVRVRYSVDHELAEQALLSATATSPDGRALPKVEMERARGGIYRASIRVDQQGEWTVIVRSAFPPGNTSITVEVGNGEGSPRLSLVLGAVAVLVVAVGAFLWRRGSKRNSGTADK